MMNSILVTLLYCMLKIDVFCFPLSTAFAALAVFSFAAFFASKLLILFFAFSLLPYCLFTLSFEALFLSALTFRTRGHRFLPCYFPASPSFLLVFMKTTSLLLFPFGSRIPLYCGIILLMSFS